jgi:rod shape-determining protein MreC
MDTTFGVRRSPVSRRFYLALAVVGLLALLLFSPVQKRVLPFVDLSLSIALYPIQNGLHATWESATGFVDRYLLLVDTKKESETLRKTLQASQIENQRLKAQLLLLPRLHALLDYQASTPMKLKAAGVIGREPTHWYQTVLLNKGADDGLKPDMGVLTMEGVVGTVIKVLPHHAQVLLMTDRNAAVAAAIERTRDGGIVEGIGVGPDTGMMRVKYLPMSSQVIVGDSLVTSGLAGSFSAGIPIGEVTHVARKEGELFLDVKAKPAAGLSRLEEVLVILDTGGEVPPGIEQPAP